jgi:ubiquinone/menaquinone biosynthesis C-methylase UbiE
MQTPHTALTVLIVSATEDDPHEMARAWSGFLGDRAISSEVLIASDGPFGACIRTQLQHATGEYLLILDAAGACRPGEWFQEIWHRRGAAGVILAGSTEQTSGLGGMARRAVLRAWKRLLALPVLPDAAAILCRRSAMSRAAHADGRFEWLLESMILANCDGWPLLTADGPQGPPVQPGSTSVSALWRLWVLRNSAFSADYDERAFNSIIPLQRYWHRQRHRIINQFADRRTSILDLGCGSSRIVQDLPDAVGLDVQVKKLRRIATRTHKVVQATITQLPFREHAFETIICSQVIEHVPHALVDWCEINRVLSPGGTLVVGTPDYATIAWPLLERMYAIVHPKGYVHEHINRYTARSLRQALESHGFEPAASAYVGGGELIIKATKVKDCRQHGPAGHQVIGPARSGTTDGNICGA